MVNTVLSGANMGFAYFVGADLAGANLAHTDVKGADFSYAKLVDADLTTFLQDVRAGNIEGCPLLLAWEELTYTCIRGHIVGPSMNLSYLNLQDYDLSGLNLSGLNLENSNLTGADLSGADLTGTDLTGVNLNGVRWENKICPDGTNSDHHGNTC